MIDEGEPEFEGVNLRARRAALQEIIQRAFETARILAIAVLVNTSSQRQLDSGRRLKRSELCSLEITRQTLLAVITGNVGHPLIIGEEAKCLRKARRKELSIDFAVSLFTRLSFEV